MFLATIQCMLANEPESSFCGIDRQLLKAALQHLLVLACLATQRISIGLHEMARQVKVKMLPCHAALTIHIFVCTTFRGSGEKNVGDRSRMDIGCEIAYGCDI